MKILFATTEAVPFCKTGGLGDVCGSLPGELEKLGHEVVLVMPAFRQAKKCGQPIQRTTASFKIPIGRKMVPGAFLQSRLPGSNVPVYLIEQDAYFDRPHLYMEKGTDYKDNCERFVFFARAVLEAVQAFELQPEVIHCHDWPAGLLPAYLQTEYRGVPPFDGTASVFTIHNLAFQGNFWHWDMELTGIDWKYFNWRQMEFYGNLSFLKTGLAFADVLTTVSPRYAQEIQSPPLSCGMEGILSYRSAELFGIINGVDYETWNPDTDPHLGGHNYDVRSVARGKAACKQALQRELGLPVRPQTPLLASIGRLTEQKGFELITEVMSRWAENTDAQWVILGTGDAALEAKLGKLASQHPHRVACRLEFSDQLAHRIEAGADMFLMPSRFEPCGLNQLYSLKYGTVPIVRATGGLADTVTDFNDHTRAPGTANGFSFVPFTAPALEEALIRALKAYQMGPTWQQLVQTGMQQDWSWANSARKYDELYARTCAAVSSV